MTLLLTTRVEHVTACPWVWFLIKKCDVKGGEGGGQKVNVIVTLRSAKVVWKCPLRHCCWSHVLSMDCSLHKNISKTTSN